MKAMMASGVSLVPKFTVCAAPSSSSASSMVTFIELLSMRLLCAIAIGGEATRRAAQPATNASRSASGSTRLTRPSSFASAASTMSPKNASSLAMCRPTRRGNTHEPPKSSERPRREKISEKRAVSDATTKSHPNARLHPAPTATPRTLAMVGWGMRCNDSATSVIWRIALSWWRGGPSPGAAHRSAPEQNSPPAPVMMTARSSARPEMSRKVSSNSIHI